MEYTKNDPTWTKSKVTSRDKGDLFVYPSLVEKSIQHPWKMEKILFEIYAYIGPGDAYCL